MSMDTQVLTINHLMCEIVSKELPVPAVEKTIIITIYTGVSEADIIYIYIYICVRVCVCVCACVIIMDQMCVWYLQEGCACVSV